MDPGQFESSLGIAMSALGTFASALVSLLPKRKLFLWSVAAVSLSVAVCFFFRAASASGNWGEVGRLVLFTMVGASLLYFFIRTYRALPGWLARLWARAGVRLGALSVGFLLATWQAFNAGTRAVPFGAVAGALFVFLALSVRDVFKTWRVRRSNPLVSRDRVIHLRAVYGDCHVAADLAYRLLASDICARKITESPGVSDLGALLGDRLREIMLPLYDKEIRNLATVFDYTRPPGKLDFNANIAGVLSMMSCTYPAMVSLINRAGAGFLGRQKLTALPRYAELFEAHRRCLERLQEANRGEHGEDIRAVAPANLLGALGVLLSPPVAAPVLTSKGFEWHSESHRPQPGSDSPWWEVVTISPLPGSDLPQPLEMFVTCEDSVAEVSSIFYRDGQKGGDHVETIHPNEETFSLSLPPKLWQSARWELAITSTDDKQPVKVVSVKREES